MGASNDTMGGTKGPDREELDEILDDTNAKVDETDEAAAAEYFGDPLPGKPGDPIGGPEGPGPVDTSDMSPDPKPDNYYGGGLLGRRALTASPVGPAWANPQATLMLEKIRIALKTHVSPAVLDQMKFTTEYDPITDKIMMELGMYLFSNKIHTETIKGDYPAGWFQGFKDAYFPGWLKRKFPVKYTQFFEEVKTVHICPHLNYRTRDEEKFHLQFLMPEGDLTRAQS